MALHPSLPFAESLPHPVLPSSRVVGGLSEKVDFEKVQQSTSNYKPNKRTTRVKKKKKKVPRQHHWVLLLGNCPGQETWLNMKQGSNKLDQNPQAFTLNPAMSLLINTLLGPAENVEIFIVMSPPKKLISC